MSEASGQAFEEREKDALWHLLRELLECVSKCHEHVGTDQLNRTGDAWMSWLRQEGYVRGD